jgi:surface carbohydrate biosynthesis protein
MYRKIINIIKSYSLIRLRFDFPKKNKLLLFDEIHSIMLREIIKKDFNILEVRNKKIYFWIYIKQIIFFDLSFKTYCKNYIKFTSPKVIITMNDARFQMYELKSSFKEIYFISVMNGLRFGHWFNKMKNFFPNKFNGDYFFLLNRYYIPQYQKLINSKYHVLGHFRNNSVKVKKTKFHKQFLFISQTFDVKKEVNFHNKLLKFVNLYLSNSNRKIHILLRRKKVNPLQQEEIDYYKKIFKSNCVFHQNEQWEKKYEILDKFENIIFTLSTMGFESIARKKKVANFMPNNFKGSNLHFGWPAPYQKENDFFSTNNLTYNEVSRVLKNIDNCSQNNWNKKYYSAIKDKFYLDENNKKLRNLILKLIKIKKI